LHLVTGRNTGRPPGFGIRGNSRCQSGDRRFEWRPNRRRAVSHRRLNQSHRETMVDLVRMENVAIKMSAEELRALLEMVDNQLFRMKYIDSKIPGHQ
jgi:dynactin complex subunit